MMNSWAPLRGDSLLTRYLRNINAYLLINSSAAMLQDLDDFLRAGDVFTVTRDIDGGITSCTDALVSILRSKE